MKEMRIARGSPDNSSESRPSGADQAILPDWMRSGKHEPPEYDIAVMKRSLLRS
jgi:hypothetical protein